MDAVEREDMIINKYITMLDKDRLACLVKEESIAYGKDEKISNAQQIVNILNTLFYAERLTEEHVWQFCLDAAGHVTGVFVVSKGAVNYSCINPREIYRNALLSNAVSVIIAHNHPSGECNPSKEDMEATSKIKQAGELIGIQLLDHIIVGDSYLSMRDKKLL